MTLSNFPTELPATCHQPSATCRQQVHNLLHVFMQSLFWA